MGLVSFMDYDLDYIDLEERTLQPLNNPFGRRCKVMSSERYVKDVSGPYNGIYGAGDGNRIVSPKFSKPRRIKVLPSAS